MTQSKAVRYCNLIQEINELDARLKKEAADFYDGGYSFEEINKHLIDEIEEKEKELISLMRELNFIGKLTPPL